MIHEERIAALQGLQENLGYVFQDGELLGHALVHRSFANECACAPIKDNERLEFLGDAVLDLCVSDLLMRHFPNDSEGRLSKRRAACVNERTLAEIAKRFRLGEYLLLGKGEELSGGRSKPSLLADAFEAVVAAIYLDGGFENASAFVQRLFTDLVEKGLQDILYKDYKTLLQETSQVRFREAPRYSVVQESGPDHDKTFEVRLDVSGHATTTGLGKSRKEAEQEAARKALEYLGHLPEGGRPPAEGGPS